MLYESGFAPRWYVPSDDVVVERAAWSYRAPFDDMAAIGDLVSFEPERVEVTRDGERLEPEPGQTVVSHGIKRNLSIGEAGALTPVLQGVA